jgi:hypothetical protein
MANFDYSPKVLAKYVDNGGKEYKRKIFAEYYATEELGWTAGDPANGTLPKGIRPRHAMVYTAAGARRKVIVATNAALAALVPGTTTVTVPIEGESTAATVNSLQGEHSIGQG